MKKIYLVLSLVFLTPFVQAQNVGIFEENPLNTLHIGTQNNASTITPLVDGAITTNTQVITPTIRVEQINRANNTIKFQSRFFNLSNNLLNTKTLSTVPLSVNKNGELVPNTSFEDVNRNFNRIIGLKLEPTGVYQLDLLNNFEIKSKSIVHVQTNVTLRNIIGRMAVTTSTAEYSRGSVKLKSYFVIKNKTTNQEIIAGVDEKFMDGYTVSSHRRPHSLTPQLFTVLEPGRYDITLYAENLSEDWSPLKDETDVERQGLVFNHESDQDPTLTRQASNLSFNIFPL